MVPELQEAYTETGRVRVHQDNVENTLIVAFEMITTNLNRGESQALEPLQNTKLECLRY